MLVESIFIWIAFEIMHYIYYLFVHYFISKKKYYEQKDDKKITHYWMKNYIINTLTKKELKDLIEDAFVNKNYGAKTIVSLDQIKYENMLKWTSHIIFIKSMWQLTREQYIYAKEILYKIELKLGVTFSVGKNSDLYVLRFGNNKIKASWKPFIYYLISRLIKYSVYMYLYMKGYRCIRSKLSGVAYFIKQNPKHSKYTFFIHGFGFGVVPNMKLIDSLSQNSNVIFPILPNISNIEFHSYFDKMTYNTLFPEYNLWIQDFEMLIDTFKIKKCDMVGHSFGTIILNMLKKHHAFKSCINKTVYIDPVCFLDGIYKMYRYINNPFDKRSVTFSYFLDYFVYHDIYIRYITHRFIYGPEYWIKDYNEINKDNLIVISENDQLVPIEILKNKLDQNGIKYIYVPKAQHADILLYRKYIKYINEILDYLTE